MKRIYLIPFLIIFLTACTLPFAILTTSTPTIELSPTLSINPTITLEPTATITPTPIASVRINIGEKAIFNGNFPQARQDLQSALASSNDDSVHAAALWGLGKTDFLAGNYPSALENFRNLTQQFPATEESTHAWLLLGETYFSLERYQEAADAYKNYLLARPGLLDGFVQERRGDAFSALGNQEEAKNAYSAALGSPGIQNQTELQIKKGGTFLNSGDPEAALKIYDEIFASTTNDYIKAELDLFSGRAMLALGRTDEGYGRWRHAVDNYPLAYDSYSALLGLVDANQPVDEFNRGLVDYYAQKYDVALRAFQRYASENPNHDGTVLHYMALTLRETGDYNSAIQMWDTVISKYPGNRYWDTAWDERAFTQWAYLDDYFAAANGLVQFTTQTTGSPLSVTYLLEAARILERSGDLGKAADMWESLPDRFGTEASMQDAWFQAGIVRYRMGNFSKANSDYQKALLLAKEPSDRARDLLWIGKTYEMSNDKSNASSAFEQSQISDPNGYYSLRARDLLNGRLPFAAPPKMNLNFDILSERNEAAAWLRVKFNLASDTDLSNIGAIQTDPKLQRGFEFWQVGMYDEARLEFESLRESIKTNAADLFRFGNYLLDIGAYRSAINTLRDVLTLAGYDDHSASLTAPIYFNHVRYGLYYSEIVWPVAAETGFDPLFVTSVIRQESLFEGFVHSNAGARGLMQIIPSTGASIAEKLGWPSGYTSNDLYSPYISIRLGTDYLNSNRRALNGDIYATLAAYNGGPGNASIWQNLANGDMDLELEIIRYGETRDYIRNIYAIYNVYRSIYSPVQ